MIEKIDDDCYSLDISDFEKFEGLFESNGVALNGHTFEEVIVEFCERESVDIADLEFDSESDMFCAYASNPEMLKPLQQVISKVIDEPSSLASSIASLEFEEDHTDEDLERKLRERSADEFSISGIGTLRIGMEIKHPSFGAGVIKSIMPGDSDMVVLDVLFGRDRHPIVLPGPVDIEIIE